MSRSPLSPRPRFSREGFQPLTHKNSWERDNMASSHTNGTGDVTIDIPLTKVTTSKSTGNRKADVLSPQLSNPHPADFPVLSEKHSHNHFHRHTNSDGFTGRRRKMGERGNTNRDSKDGTLTGLGKLYTTIYNFSVVTRYMIYVAPVALAIAVPIIIGATVAQSASIGGVRIVWFFTWVEIVWISLWISKLFSQFLPYLFQFVVGVISSGTRKYASVLIALEIPLSLVLWAICSLTTFVPLMTLNPDQRAANDRSLKNWQSIVKNILFACLFSTLVLLGEKLIIQLISISYHRKQFDDKIKDSKRNIYLTGLLYDASRNLFPSYCPEFAQEDFIIADVLDLGLGSRGGRSHARSGSATPMRLIQGAARVGEKVTAAFGNVAQEITGKQVFNPTSAHSIVVEALERKKSAEALAKRIWLSFVLEGRDALYPDDIRDVLGAGREVEADEAFACLDLDGNGDISLDEMVLRITEFGRERASLANSVRDVDSAISVLDNLLCTVVFIMVIFIFVAWLNTNFTTTLATTGTALLSLSFVFAATCQEVLGSCIFLFVKHPFDVGDRVDITTNQYVVERISLLYTVFRSVTNHKKTQVPNIVLNTLWIDNVSRSKAMREQISLYISFDTTMEDIELLRTELQKFVLDKDNARDFQPDIDIEVVGIAEMNKLELKVEIRHKSNWAIEQVRAARRSKFMCALVLALKKVPIYAPGGGGAAAGDKANPTYSVTISDAEAEKNKKTFDDDKEKARMVPTADLKKQDQSSSTGVDFFDSSNVEARERAQVVQGGVLTNRSPVAETVKRPSMEEEAELERKRTQDVENVRTMLRRESTSTGRRKASQHDALSPGQAQASAAASAAYATATLPRISEPDVSTDLPAPAITPSFSSTIPPPPAVVVPSPSGTSHLNPTSGQQPVDRVSYYEDHNLPGQSYGITPSPYAPQPINTQISQSRTRSESISTSPQSAYGYPIQGNSSSQTGVNQTQSASRGRSDSASRRPAAGTGYQNIPR